MTKDLLLIFTKTPGAFVPVACLFRPSTSRG
jgi:hypothetical protein